MFDIMPGENCAIYGCSASRRYKGISFFKVPLASNDFNKKWGCELINIITKYRVIDAALKSRIESRELFICERHFTKDQYYTYETRKSLKEGELPKVNLPEKSLSTVVATSRSTVPIQKREEHHDFSPPPSPSPFIYKDFTDFVTRIAKLSLRRCWQLDVKETYVVISEHSDEYLIPKHEIFVDVSLSFTVRTFGWMLTEDHELYSTYDRSFLNVTLSNFINHLMQFNLCNGIATPDPGKVLDFQKHVIPKKFDYVASQKLSNKPRKWQDEYFRSNHCKILNHSSTSQVCSSCLSAFQKFSFQNNRKLAVMNQPAKLNAPIKFTSPERIKLTLQDHRLKCKQLEEELSKMRSEIEKKSEVVDPTLNEDFKTLFSGSDKSNIPNFMKLFWEEQQKYINSSSSSSVRYHPMIIRFCLNLAAKSSSAYSDLRYDPKTGNGFLVLPSLRTLRDYKNYIRPTRGFNPAVIKDLKQKTENFSSTERFVTILFDEMKIQEDLVWDKYSGELIGFIDLGDINTNYATLSNVEELATHILVFLVKSVVNPLSFSFASFATAGITSYQIMPIFWKAVLYLEQINLHVIAATADGASPNRKFFRMHKDLQGNSQILDVVYRARNIYAAEIRYIYFFADVPHLIKTTRNCLSNSGSGRATRYMWNSGVFILWSHITQIYDEQLQSGLKLAPKLSSDHMYLTPYSVMRVNLAVQVLSETVGNVLKQFGPAEAAGTSKFCLMMDKFFDCLNVRNTVEHEHKRKPFLKPYVSVDDERFTWLDNFLDYFRLWKESIEERPHVGPVKFTQDEKAKMFVSWQTHEGLQVTVHSFKEVVKYLLENGVKYVLSERFCQDDLENYFGRQRAIGRRKDNLSVRDAGYNDNTIKSQFSVRPIAGNVQGTAGKFNIIDNTPLPKRRK